MDTTRPLTRWIGPIGFGAVFLVAMAGALAHYEFGFSSVFRAGHAWGADDAYISYRYAENLADGRGLVYNADSGERVEGFTNFLYVVLLAGMMKVLPLSAYHLSFGVNMVFYAATLLLFGWCVRRALPLRDAWIACLLLSLCPLMWAWPAAGLETSCVLLVQLALFVATDFRSTEPTRKNGAWLLGLSVASMLLRADGFVFPMICGVLLLVRKRYRAWFQLTAFVAAFVAVCMAVRYGYYGAILPNTYYAKVCCSLGERIASASEQLRRLSLNNAMLLYLAPLLLGWRPFFSAMVRERRFNLSRLPAIPLAAIGLLAYWFYVGGDAFYERFLLIVIPLSLLHLFEQWNNVATSRGLGWKSAVAAVVLVAQFAPFAYDGRFSYQRGKYDDWTALGGYLAAKHPEATLAICAAGKVPYFSHLKTLDMLGLNDAYIARTSASGAFVAGHSKYDPDYVLSRRPDLIATWATPDFNMSYGLTRDKYASSGYRIKYVVNSSTRSKPYNVVDVGEMDRVAIKKLYASGYQFFVLTKVDRKPSSAEATASRGEGSALR